MKHFFIAAITCFASASAAFADPSTGAYVRIDVGGSGAQDADLRDIDFNNNNNFFPICGNAGCTTAGRVGDTDLGAAFTFGAGYQLTSLFRVDVTYTHGSGYDLHDSDASGAAFGGKISSNTWMFNTYVDLPFKIANFTPYLGVGLGSSEVKINDLTLTVTNPPPVLVFNLPKGSERSFAWQLMAGASVPITETLLLDVGYRYFDGGDMRVDADANLGFTGYEGEWTTHDVTAGLRLKF